MIPMDFMDLAGGVIMDMGDLDLVGEYWRDLGTWRREGNMDLGD